jgi:ATP-dependent helicase/DNAse subunit B
VPLTLVTGPANAGKARLVLDGLRARADEDPILVVPTARDARAYRRELAAGGSVFGARVVRFAGLAREVAARVGLGTAPLRPVQRERVVAAAVERAGLRTLAPSAAGPGFPAAAGALIAELERERVSPERLAEAAGDAAGAEVAAIYSAYRSLLESLGRIDAELLAWRALDALAAAPERWGGTPVAFYGFDDLTGSERAAVATLAGPAGADVTVALTWEDRVALAGRGRTLAALRPLAVEEIELPARADYYAPAARDALHYLERGLFEPAAGRRAVGSCVRLLSAGGERAEVELVAAEVLDVLRVGVAPADVAVVFRSPTTCAELVRRVFGEYGIPVGVDAPLPFGDVALGRGFLGLLRCALSPGATAADLLAYLRTPGLLERPELADDLEARVRREGIGDAAGARGAWEARRWPLDALERLSAAAGRGPAALLERAGAELRALFAAPRRRAAATLSPEELVDARALAAATAALAELAELPALAPAPAGLADALARVEVPGEADPGAVQVLDPLALRARRVRALFLCGLQEGELPRPGRGDPFLADDRRRELGLREREDALDDERALFYASVSRPEELLVLSYRTCDEEGRPAVRSPFVDDVGGLFAGPLVERARPLAQAAWAPDAAPTPRERARAAAASGPRDAAPRIAPLRDPGVLAALRDRPAWSAGQLERHAGCPVRWLVESWVAPERLEPDPEPLARGNAAHRLLEATLRRLRAETGSARLTDATLPRARAVLREELERQASELPRLSTVPARRRSELRRLEADLLRYLRRAAEAASPLEPTHLELQFGFDGGELPPLELEGLRVRGRIDRVDVDAAGRRAAVYDYKGTAAHGADTWLEGGHLQVGLYMLAVRDLLGLEPVAGFYQPLARQQRARGAVRDDGDLAEGAVRTDRRTAEGLDELLAGVAGRAREVADSIRAGELEPRPATCGWDGHCLYPGVCRCEP